MAEKAFGKLCGMHAKETLMSRLKSNEIDREQLTHSNFYWISTKLFCYLLQRTRPLYRYLKSDG